MQTSPNRQRYQLLIERRRVLLELETLESRIREHPMWAAACAADPTLGDALEARRGDLTCALCAHACQAGSEMLLCDVRRVMSAVVDLARVWVALEDGRIALAALDADPDRTG